MKNPNIEDGKKIKFNLKQKIFATTNPDF